jgi:hypothetical protein
VALSSFETRASWTIIELIQASAEVWRDLADVEDDSQIADGFRAMASDLERYAAALGSDGGDVRPTGA